MSVDNRWAIVKKDGVCFQRLSPHGYRSCTSSTCPTCKLHHHSSLHRQEHPLSPNAVPYKPVMFTPFNHPLQANTREQENKWNIGSWRNQNTPEQNQFVHQGPPPQTQHPTDQQLQQYNITTRGGCYSPTALEVAVSDQGTCMVRLLIDSGSDSSYIRSSVADYLGLKVISTATFACVGFQERIERAQKYDEVKIIFKCRNDGLSLECSLWKTQHLCVPLSLRTPPPSLEGIQLADDFREGPLDILMGTDQMYDIILLKQIPISRGLRAIETIFGNIIHGTIGETRTASYHQSLYRSRVDRLWDLDTLGIVEDEVKDISNYPEPKWNTKERRYMR